MEESPFINDSIIQNSFLCDLEKGSKSLLMQDILQKIIKIAQINTHVIIVGEIGSGKKRIAEIIHKHSNRSEGPFYSFYCPAVEEEEYKNNFWEELHFEKDHIILKYHAIEKACRGILYLDQFSELPLASMVNIIDSFVIGNNQLYRFDEVSRPRMIISVNMKSYQKILHTDEWRSIMSLLDPMTILLPPLRERKEDIPVIIHYLLKTMKDKYEEWNAVSISPQALYSCYNYNWPGNLRQLKNAIVHGAILSQGQIIEDHHLPFSLNWRSPYESN
ncbi:sigma 54-interacting transcriptional regulator [Fodinibius sp. AD559]|uniref:sigma 54-interacting transcriptional regulator n=1 Tax=Fodinibius sp. AD559 TaxID=3424179 RepID=UPI004046A6F2